MDLDVFEGDEARWSVTEFKDEGQKADVGVDDDGKGKAKGRLLRKRPLVVVIFVQEIFRRPPLGRAGLQVLAVVQPRMAEGLFAGGQSRQRMKSLASGLTWLQEFS